MSTPKGLKLYFIVGAILTVLLVAGDTLQSLKFGATVSLDFMLIVGAISLASSLLLVFAAYYWFKGWKPLGIALAIAWIPCFGFNIISNMGVATSNRMAEVQRATKVRTNYTQKTANKTDAEARIKFAKDNRQALQQDFRELTTVKVGNWSATAAPSSTKALDELIAAKEAERAREEGRQYCGPKCEARAAEKRHLIKLRGVAAKLEDIEGQIAASERVLLEARQVVDKADTGISHTMNQATLYAKWLRWTANPDAGTIESANEGMGVFAAFVLALISCAMSLAGAWKHLVNLRPDTGIPSESLTGPPNHFSLSRSTSLQTHPTESAAGMAAPVGAPSAQPSPAALPHQQAAAPVAYAASPPQVVYAQPPAERTQIGLMNDEEAKALARDLRMKINQAVTNGFPAATRVTA